nr:protein transport protein Sec24-like At3g07100 [Ipomoea batatas]
MAADFTKYQIAVNVYTFDKYTDVATLGTLAKYTGGQVYHYPSFQATIHKDKLSQELARDLTRETAWEAVMRIRCGKGVRFTTYHGNFMLRSTDLIALPAVDCDKAYAMQLSLEETLLTTQTVYFQVALLYPSNHRNLSLGSVLEHETSTPLRCKYRLKSIWCFIRRKKGVFIGVT